VGEAHNYFAGGIKVSNSSAKTYRGIFDKCGHIYYRFGMTGTHFRSGTDDMEMHGLISNVLYKVESKELLERGFLVPTRVAFVPVTGPKLRGVAKQFNIGHGKYGIHEHTLRNQLVTQAAVTLNRMGRKVLILVGTKAQGRRIKAMLDHWFPEKARTQFDAVEFVSTDRDRGLQTQILEAYLESDEVQILIGTSLVGEGVDLPIADALVYARGESAEVSITQNAFRVCTAAPTKRDAIIVDFWDQHHSKLKKHSDSRWDVFNKEPIFQVEMLDDIMNLEQWVNGGA
jgi:superfamily II DNA or RNA helicase